MSVWILRMGHRLHRDERISTHCALTSRAFGADGIIYSGEKDDSVIDSVKKVVKKWGGPFEVRYEKKWKKVINEWKGIKILLTMYGINLPDVIDEIRNLKKDILIIVGSEKTPPDLYEMVDYQVAISNQPHSEVASLAVFLDWYFQGEELKKKFSNAKLKVIPTCHGKRTESRP